MKKKSIHKNSAPVLRVDESVSLQEQIAQRAHELWHQRSREHGTMLAAALMPQLVGSLCNLFLQTHAFVHTQNGSGIFVNGFLFHKSPFTCIDFSQKSASSTMR